MTPPRFPAEAQALRQAATPPSVAPHLLRHRYRMPHPTLHNVWAKGGGRCGSGGTVAGLLGITIFKCEVWAGRGTQGLLLVLFVFGIWETGTEVGKASRYSAIDQIGPTQHNSESSAWHVSSSAERTMISVSQHVFQPWWLNQGTACWRRNRRWSDAAVYTRFSLERQKHPECAKNWFWGWGLE